MRLIAVIFKPSVVEAILGAIGVPDDPGRIERLHPTRGPPRDERRVVPYSEP